MNTCTYIVDDSIGPCGRDATGDRCALHADGTLPCPACNGGLKPTGNEYYDYGARRVKCPDCLGTGVVAVQPDTQHPFASGFGEECAVCGKARDLHNTETEDNAQPTQPSDEQSSEWKATKERVKGIIATGALMPMKATVDILHIVSDAYQRGYEAGKGEKDE